MAEENKPKQGQINIELDGDVAQGIYSNLAIINHSQSEFVLDFVTIMPGVSQKQGKVSNRAYSTTCQAFLKSIE